ncbi:MAG: hypothetical protein LUG92_04070, partial [Oscillospiraceae bacterium]|nr:hypothetical protein [Oscillospiraceae bacterium]
VGSGGRGGDADAGGELEHQAQRQYERQRAFHSFSFHVCSSLSIIDKIIFGFLLSAGYFIL